MLAATCRKVSYHAAVSWHKGNVSRKIQTQGICGPQKELALASTKMTFCAKVA
jgi:hypothetical protein